MDTEKLEYEIERLDHEINLLKANIRKETSAFYRNDENTRAIIKEALNNLRYNLTAFELIKDDLSKLLEIEKMIN